MFWHGPERDDNLVVCRLGVYDPGVRSVRTGIDGVGVSAVSSGKSLQWGTASGHLTYRWHRHSRVLC